MKSTQEDKASRRLFKTARRIICVSGFLATAAYFVRYLFFKDEPEDVDEDFFAAAKEMKQERESQ